MKRGKPVHERREERAAKPPARLPLVLAAIALWASPALADPPSPDCGRARGASLKRISELGLDTAAVAEKILRSGPPADPGPSNITLQASDFNLGAEPAARVRRDSASLAPKDCAGAARGRKPGEPEPVAAGAIPKMVPVKPASPEGVAARVALKRRKAVDAQVRVDSGRADPSSGFTRATADVKFGQGTWVPGKAEVAVGSRYADSALSDDGTVAVDTQVRLEQHLQTRPLEVSRGIDALVDGSVRGAAGLDGQNGTIQVDGQARAEQRSDGGKYAGTYRAGARLETTTGLKKGYKTTYAQVIARYKLLPELTLLTDLLYSKGPNGMRGRIEAGVAARVFSVTGHATGRLLPAEPTLANDAFWRAGGRLSWRPTESASASLVADAPIEGGEIRERARITGTFNMTY